MDFVTLGGNPSDVAVNPTTHRVYVTEPIFGRLYVLDGETNQVLTSFTLGGAPRPVGVDSAQDRVYVGDQFGNMLLALDGTTGAVVGSLALGANTPVALAVNPLSGLVYVAMVDSSTGTVWSLLMISTDGGLTIADEVPLDIPPAAVGVDPTRDRVYVHGGGVLEEFDADTLELTATIPTGFGSSGIFVEPDRVFAAADVRSEEFNFSGGLFVVQPSREKVKRTFTVGLTPIGVGRLASTKTVYVANSLSDTVTVILGVK
jgi:DNA-binding beta-propeller fold protein YncE